jgi:mono/diheme cytochrome c family protein
MMKNMRRVLLVLIATVGVNTTAENTRAEGPTFYRDVLPLLQEHCQDCHRPGGDNISGMIAPMSLVGYSDVRPWARSIKKAVATRAMPPWGASDETSVHIVNNRNLDPSAISTMVAWVDRGAPAGDATEAPEPRIFAGDSRWIIGEPDLIVTMPEPLLVPDDAVDFQPYVTFALTPEQLPEPRWIRAVEYRPNCDIVHHLTATIVPPPDEDGNEREPFFLGGIASGSEPREYPQGFGRILHPGSQIVMSIHYNKEAGPGTGIHNQVSMGLVFYDPEEEVKYEIRQTRIGRFFDFEIPPGHPGWKTGASMEFNEWALLTSMWPHMHYRGKDMKYTIFYPDGTEELLLDVVHYNFAWQMRYTLDRPKLIPPGARIEVESHHDNSAEQGVRIPEIDTTQPVKWGLASTDEMMHGFVSWAPIDEAEAKRWSGAGI